MALIVDDSADVWPVHRHRLLVPRRYHFFDSSASRDTGGRMAAGDEASTAADAKRKSRGTVGYFGRPAGPHAQQLSPGPFAALVTRAAPRRRCSDEPEEGGQLDALLGVLRRTHAHFFETLAAAPPAVAATLDVSTSLAAVRRQVHRPPALAQLVARSRSRPDDDSPCHRCSLANGSSSHT